MLTCRTEAIARIVGLDLGADDSITKPFSAREVVARVRAVLRRAQFTASEQALRTTTTIGDLTIDYAQHLVTLAGATL